MEPPKNNHIYSALKNLNPLPLSPGYKTRTWMNAPQGPWRVKFQCVRNAFLRCLGASFALKLYFEYFGLQIHSIQKTSSVVQPNEARLPLNYYYCLNGLVYYYYYVPPSVQPHGLCTWTLQT
jgi:hypothetical protein